MGEREGCKWREEKVQRQEERKSIMEETVFRRLRRSSAGGHKKNKIERKEKNQRVRSALLCSAHRTPLGSLIIIIHLAVMPGERLECIVQVPQWKCSAYSKK
ncbi:uncharacterized protein LOC127246140 [Andrographis paniculata]|uniref:uncharacterized protein LOC127246140 n=1 Tax=Andrographis paniculata TaxID=175694 RepID=UPI0021E7ACB8|nr:uncharacterized protein LOC127246140 [Andrographis paniculata]